MRKNKRTFKAGRQYNTGKAERGEKNMKHSKKCKQFNMIKGMNMK